MASDFLKINVVRASGDPGRNPMPHVISTPSGLALLEIQGTINLPEESDEGAMSTGGVGEEGRETPIGRLVFDGYRAEGESDEGWMKRVYLYVGKHQRMSGEVKKLPKAIAILRKRRGEEDRMELDEGQGSTQDLEVVEIVKYKILFSTRPEPVGTLAVGI